MKKITYALLSIVLLAAACKKTESTTTTPATGNNNNPDPKPQPPTNAAQLKKYTWLYKESLVNGKPQQLHDCFMDDFWTFDDKNIYIDAGAQVCPNGQQQVTTLPYTMDSNDKTFTATGTTGALQMEIMALDSTQLVLRYTAPNDTNIYTDSFVPKK